VGGTMLTSPAPGASGAGFQGGFPRWLRQAGVLWVAVTVPLVTVVGAFARGQREYLLVFVVLASGLYTTPALVVTGAAIRRATAHSRTYWRLWLAALIGVYSTGCGILAGLATGITFGPVTGVAIILLTWVCVTGAVAGHVRSRSGRRAVSVDVVEWLMFVVVVAAPAVLLWSEAVLRAEAVWFAVPAALTAVGMASGFYWIVVLSVRLGHERGAREWFGLALTLLGVLNAALQTAQGISGFTLPGAPLIGLQALCMSLLLLVPLYEPAHESSGLNRLPLRAQIRGAGLAPVVTLVGLPVLLVVMLVQRDHVTWATELALAATVLLLVLAVVRQLLAVRETRRLHSLVEKAGRDRRDLLARMIRRIDEDRHAVAAQLHEQAMSAYATFVSYLLATSRTTTGGASSPSALLEASAMVRDDMSRQAESLRQLMLAVGPLDTTGRVRSEGLQVPVQAYVDSLYGDHPAPSLRIEIDPELVLDWITETIVLRIVQEAVRNVWRHSGATSVEVALDVVDGLFEVRVADDGVGFAPGTVLYESGIKAMRSFAAFTNGTVEVTSSPGRGTVVRARLGPAPAGGTGQDGNWATA
jgi:signal transduction histidine kinase